MFCSYNSFESAQIQLFLAFFPFLKLSLSLSLNNMNLNADIMGKGEAHV